LDNRLFTVRETGLVIFKTANVNTSQLLNNRLMLNRKTKKTKKQKKKTKQKINK
jgi:hypothetical protein